MLLTDSVETIPCFVVAIEYVYSFFGVATIKVTGKKRTVPQ